MLKLSYAQINGPLMSALADVRENVKMPLPTAVKVTKIWGFLNLEVEKARASHLELVKKHALLDEKGELKAFPAEVAKDPTGKELIDQNGQKLMTRAEPFRIAPTEKDAYEKAMVAFMERVVALPYEPISLHMFGNAEMTPECLEALLPILKDA